MECMGEESHQEAPDVVCFLLQTMTDGNGS